MNKDMKRIEKAYKKALNWLSENVNCNTFTLSWYEMGVSYVTVLVKTVTSIDAFNQIESEYILKVKNDNTLEWLNK